MNCDVCGMPRVETKANVFECLIVVWARQYDAENA